MLHSDGPRPAVVEMGPLVSQAPPLSQGVLDHVAAGRVHGALPHGLRDEEEVIPEIPD